MTVTKIGNNKKELIKRMAVNEAKKMSRRLRRVPLDPRMVFNLFTWSKGRLMEVNGIPEGAKYIGIAFDAPTMHWQMFVEHDSFDIVPEKETIPELLIEIKTRSLVELEEVKPNEESVQQENPS